MTAQAMSTRWLFALSAGLFTLSSILSGCPETVDRRAVITAKRLAELGKPHPERLAASMLAEMVGAVALARAQSPIPPRTIEF